MGGSSVFRAFVLAGALAAAPVASAIDFTLISIGQAPSGVCDNNQITNVVGVAVSYNLLDNGNGVDNIRFTWTITPSVGSPFVQSQSFWFDPESAVQMDVQDWFDQEFGGSVPVPGNPTPPWVGTIVGSPIDNNGNVVGTSARYTIQCDGTNASVDDIVSGIGRGSATPVPVDAPGALAALILVCLAFGMRFAARRGRR
jgi:hypothetical protein